MGACRIHKALVGRRDFLRARGVHLQLRMRDRVKQERHKELNEIRKNGVTDVKSALIATKRGHSVKAN